MRGLMGDRFLKWFAGSLIRRKPANPKADGQHEETGEGKINGSGAPAAEDAGGKEAGNSEETNKQNPSGS